MATAIKLKNFVKRFGSAEVLHGIDLKIEPGEFAVFVGPSGFGKSALLRMIASLEAISDGDLLIGGERANDLQASERGIAMVFQSYALYPHLAARLPALRQEPRRARDSRYCWRGRAARLPNSPVCSSSLFERTDTLARLTTKQ